MAATKPASRVRTICTCKSTSVVRGRARDRALACNTSPMGEAHVTGYLGIVADGWRFQPRVAAVFLAGEHVLLQRATDGPFWVFPGGRVHPLERTSDALVRTMRGEIGQDVTVRQLHWVMEYLTGTNDGRLHELGFYYAVDLPEGSPFLDLAATHSGTERGHELTLRWFPIDALEDVPLLPSFFRTALRQPPEDIRHVVVVETHVPPTA
jgi:8-oxo-dGTP pyrophosphatase MutT (NUDIX family)